MQLRSVVLPLAAGLSAISVCGSASSQLTDLQPGRNFVQTPEFEGGRTENADVGDVDLDGDLDVFVGNGGDGAGQDNRIFINQGGAQLGTLGTFLNETATRFPVMPNDRTRDVEFVDIEDDGDLDVHVTNRGTTVDGGEPCRFYLNLGGAQLGTVGTYSEVTDSAFGHLVSVPVGQQVFGNGEGPFRDYGCDCDFADLSDDGDLDMFHSSYGANINGTRNSLIFLNDGDGVFHELWPWANIFSGADIKTHTLDMDLADLDGDFDIDVAMSSRDSQARIYENNLYEPVGSEPFQDVTQSALIDTGATLSGSNNYELEIGDVDGDGDFDLWMNSYDGFTERILRNDTTPGCPIEFTKILNWIDGDPNVDENEVDFFDFDNDGDLDAFVSNFSGTNYLFYNGHAQGIGDEHGEALFHRAGGGGSLAQSFPETPASGNGGTTLDADAADMDNDGDLDLVLSNDANQSNRYYENLLGVPDTHAPTIAAITDQDAKSDGSDTVIHARIGDNAPYYLSVFYEAELLYSDDAAPEVVVPMFAQGGQQYRGVIPGELSGTISYSVRVTDLAGNTGTSDVFDYVQGDGAGAWSDLGFALDGLLGEPKLQGSGLLAPGTPGSLLVTNASPASSATLFISTSSTPTPFKGGTLVTVPLVASLPFVTTVFGQIQLTWTSWPGGLPSGFELFFQYGIADATAVAGVALSNGLKAVTP